MSLTSTNALVAIAIGGGASTPQAKGATLSCTSGLPLTFSLQSTALVQTWELAIQSDDATLNGKTFTWNRGQQNALTVPTPTAPFSASYQSLVSDGNSSTASLQGFIAGSNASGGGGGGGSVTTADFTQPSALGVSGVAHMLSGTPFTPGCAVSLSDGSRYVIPPGGVSGLLVTLTLTSAVTAFGGTIASGAVALIASTNAPLAASAPGEGDTLVNASGSYTPRGVRPAFNIKRYGAAVDGATDDTAKIQAADAACVAAGFGSLYFPTGTTRFTGSLVIASAVIFEQGGILSALTPLTDLVTFKLPWTARPRQQIFSASTQVVAYNSVSQQSAIEVFYPTQWGAVTNDSGDQTAAIRSAIRCAQRSGIGAGAIVDLLTGFYSCSDTILLDGTAVGSVTDTWAATTSFAFNNHGVLPLTPNGFYFACIKPGITGGSEPTWNTLIGSRTTSGAAVFVCVGQVPAGTWSQNGITIRGSMGGGSGGGNSALIVPNFTLSNATGEYNGTGGSISSSGVLTTSGVTWDTDVTSFPTVVNIDNNTFLQTFNCAGVSVMPYGSSPPLVTATATGVVVTAGTRVHVQILTGGPRGTATFQWLVLAPGSPGTWQGPVTTGASVALGATNITLAFAVGTYVGSNDVTKSGTSPPTVTFTGSLLGAFQPVVQCTTGGTLPSAFARYSLDNGNTFTAPVAVSGGTLVLGASGLTANFPAGSYTNDNVWQLTGPNAYSVFGHNRAWRITVLSANTVQLTDPTGEFVISAADAGLSGGITWKRPLRHGVAVNARDCTLEHFGILCQGPVLAGFATSAPLNSSDIYSNNSFDTILIDKTAGSHIFGISHGDSVILPGTGFLASQSDGENFRYHKVQVNNANAAGLWSPNASGQAKENSFDKCSFVGDAARAAGCAIYTNTGTWFFHGFLASFFQIVAFPQSVTQMRIDNLGSESCVRLLKQANNTSVPASFQMIGGRMSTENLSPDGVIAKWRGRGSLHMDNVLVDPVLSIGLKFDVNSSGGAPAPCNLVMDACVIPDMAFVVYPTPGSGNAVKLNLRGCSGVNDGTGAGQLIADVAGVIYGS